MKELIIMEHKKTKVIYSLKLMQFLLEHDCNLIKIINHPFKIRLKAWVFEDNEHLQDSIAKFMKQRAKEERDS